MDDEYIITEYDGATGITFVRPMTTEERVQHDIDKANAVGHHIDKPSAVGT